MSAAVARKRNPAPPAASAPRTDLCPKCARAAHAGECVRSEVCQACVQLARKLTPTEPHTCNRRGGPP